MINGAPGADTDPEGDTLSVDAVAFGATTGTVGQPLTGGWGTLLLRPDGSYTYTPSALAQAPGRWRVAGRISSATGSPTVAA